MQFKKITLILSWIFIVFTVSACGLMSRDIVLVDAKTAESIDENLMPVKASDIFPDGTSTVSCWIKWRSARINTQVVTKWHYVTDDIPILDHTLIIPKKEGTGSATLTMPPGKKLPRGLYKVDLIVKRHVIRSLRFKVE